MLRRLLYVLILMGWRHRRRCGRRGRFPKPITIEKIPTFTELSPNPHTNSTPILIQPAEIEVLRLVDLMGLSQEEAGIKMGVSRGTVWRLVQSARQKAAQALSEGRAIQMVSGFSKEEVK